MLVGPYAKLTSQMSSSQSFERGSGKRCLRAFKYILWYQNF